jgi:exodeoxyribonuclease VIII
MNSGIIYDLPAADYHADPACSASALRVIHNKTPHHLAMERRKPKRQTREMLLGTLIHDAVLEPEKPKTWLRTPKEIIVPATYKPSKKDGPQPGDVVPWNLRYSFCQDWRDEVERGGVTLLTDDEADEIQRAVEGVAANPEAVELLANTKREVSLFWSLAGGTRCKARLDALGDRRIPDLKTTDDASEEGFQRHAIKMGYHLQASWYCDAATLLTDTEYTSFSFIAYERESGLVKVHHATPSLLEYGRTCYKAALERYVRCEQSGVWEGYGNACEFDVPRWVRKGEQ